MKKERKFVVSVEKCSSYNPEKVRKALLRTLKNLSFSFKPGMRVLIKPNILAPHKPEDAVTTHPVVLEELCKILFENGVTEIYIGESSSYRTDLAFKVSGIEKLKKYGKIINFESQPKRFISIDNKLKIPLPRILFEVDLIINVSKLKTHELTQVTLCIKNLYGCVPGRMKENFHKVFQSEKKMSKLFFNLYKKISPGLNIIDGIVGLEGRGPGASGKPIKSKIIIASRDAAAADIIASEIMGFNPYSIYTNKFSEIKKEDIIPTGNAKDIRLNFEKPFSYISPFFREIYWMLPKSKIMFDYDKCTKCGLCGKKCPVGAITYHPFPRCNHRKCIKCLCCIEVCPNKAVYLEDPLIKKFIKWVLRKIRKV